MDEKNNNAKYCENCGKELNGFIFRCRDCNEWICSSCHKLHHNHELIFKKLLNNLVSTIDHGQTYYGISRVSWPRLPNDLIAISKKCPHCENFLDQDHKLTAHLKDIGGYRQIDHSLYKADILLDLNIKCPEKCYEGQMIELNLILENIGKEIAYDVSICGRSVLEITGSKEFCNPDVEFYDTKICQLGTLKPSEIRKLSFKMDMPKKDEVFFLPNPYPFILL
jgi:hypothetical protein